MVFLCISIFKIYIFGTEKMYIFPSHVKVSPAPFYKLPARSERCEVVSQKLVALLVLWMNFCTKVSLTNFISKKGVRI